MTAPAGLPGERTRLAWRRTTLSATGAGLLLEVELFVDAPFAMAVPLGLLAGLGWFAVVLVAWRRIRALDSGRSTGPGRAPMIVAILVVGMATVGLGLALTV